MKSKNTDFQVKINYKNDEAAWNNFMDFLINCILEVNALEVDTNNGPDREDN